MSHSVVMMKGKGRGPHIGDDMNFRAAGWCRNCKRALNVAASMWTRKPMGPRCPVCGSPLVRRELTREEKAAAIRDGGRAV